ncbi:hypothetical protein TSUD_336650 [Trifolium subterraneum]|uniref:Reverse transcriptase zinc-binding domain-containing protein n=1 Tax=Trifolium subterraneum TaxID=3900 RepID=A0A2Z6N1U9_TRISU|nr:hypothetical protein TSUD_336650 [Trifolium subterraneum]
MVLECGIESRARIGCLKITFCGGLGMVGGHYFQMIGGVGECCTVLSNVLLLGGIPDEWEWMSHPHVGYSVCGAYPALTSSTSSKMNTHYDIIWNKIFPSKVSTFAWGLLCDRLFTKSNLFAHRCLCNDSILCSIKCTAMEDEPFITDLSCIWCDLL